MKNCINIVLIILAIPLWVDCKSKAKTEFNRFEKSNIIMQKDPCFGACPVYSISISGNGKAVYEGKKNVSKLGKFERTLNPKEVSKLFNSFDCANFFDFHSEYSANVSDVPTTWLTFEHHGYKKQVKDYYNAPEELKKLEGIVEEIALSQEGWTQLK